MAYPVPAIKLPALLIFVIDHVYVFQMTKIGDDRQHFERHSGITPERVNRTRKLLSWSTME